MTDHTSKTAPRPHKGESFERYTIRAHQALLKKVPDPDERNAVVWNTWRDHRGEMPEEKIAASTFPRERYHYSANHCSFAEHETVAKDGTPRKYTAIDLAKIVRQHNSEIRDSGSFPSLAEHHTPDPGDPNGKEPAVLGHAGPFRLGMIGRENPRWAVFNDEFQHLDTKPVLDKKPFRSVELWTFKDGRMRFHPIAAVGAEAPRLLLPAKYTARVGNFSTVPHEGGEVEKYTVGAVAAMPGGGNTFLKGSREDYAAIPGASAVSPEDISSIMSALQQTPEFQFLRRQMEEEEAYNQDDGISTPGAMDDVSGGTLPGMPSPGALSDGGELGGGGLDDLADVLGGEGEGESEPSKPAVPDSDEDEPEEKMTATVNRGAAVSVEKYTALQNSHNAVVEKYTALQKSHDSLVADVQKYSERMQAIERSAEDVRRKAKIDELAGKYSFAVDGEEEAKLCLYSQGSTMTPEQFDTHFAMVEKYGQRFENAPMIPKGTMPSHYTPAGDKEKYSQRLTETAVQIHTAAQSRGQNLDWDACKAEAEKRLKAGKTE